ncbi:uncharacterized protein LOC132620215 [Lycium barbarum]|uniref:uncharacterized protein LOC132620215 n=1 Tax=Lycium barbarum TaxID=112863 RepID=UPI00293F58D4|nr:uncharacterized protein LOC132620215 [Lycium barbarum]
MTWLFWNVRGINKRYKQKELKQYLLNKRIKLAGIVETRVKEQNMANRLNKIAPRWSSYANYQEAVNGRIWFLWDPNWYEVSLKHKTTQMMHCHVRDRTTDNHFLITVIYGFNTLEQRKSLWEDLKGVNQGINQPWILAGDFNAVMAPQDRMCGNPVTLAEVQDFNDCIQQLAIHELPWHGDYYTWSNKQQGQDRITSRIDRIFGNFEWMVQWGQVVTTYELPFISDHAPMTILLQSQQRPRNVPFKFFNVWATHEKFLHIVNDIWSQSLSAHRMKDVWLKLQALKPALRKLNNTEFKFIRVKIENAKTELNRVQEHLSVHATDNMIIQEKKILLNLEKWSLLEESALKQKSRARWI